MNIRQYLPLLERLARIFNGHAYADGPYLCVRLPYRLQPRWAAYSPDAFKALLFTEHPDTFLLCGQTLLSYLRDHENERRLVRAPLAEGEPYCLWYHLYDRTLADPAALSALDHQLNWLQASEPELFQNFNHECH